jgi:DNA relaxase NicK
VKGFYGYQDRLYYDGISIHHNGTAEMGICAEMSGQGCRNFESFGKGNYDDIFALILENYDDDSERRQMNITRLDVVSTAPHWLNWIESFESVSIFDKPGVEYNIVRCENYVFKQAGRAVDTLIKIHGVDSFMEKLKENIPPQSIKYATLIEKHGAKDEETQDRAEFVQTESQ